TTFTFQMRPGSNPIADGLTFTLQRVSPTQLGGSGGAMGYQGINNSVAIKFDAYKPSGNHSSTGLFVGGSFPGIDSLETGDVYQDLTGTGIDFNGAAFAAPPHTFTVTLSYDSSKTLFESITDLTTHATFNRTYSVDLVQQLGGTFAYVGF